MEKQNFWQRIAAAFSGRAEQRGVRVEPTGATPPMLPDFGVTVDNNTALKNTALYAGIRLIAENIASLPKSVRIDDGKGGMREVYDDPMLRIINRRPNSYTNAFSFWTTIVTWIKGWGNAYAVILRKNGVPVSIHQAHPCCVRITMVKGRKWYRVEMSDPNLSYLSGTYSDDDVMHFMEMSLDGIRGINPVIYNAAALGKSFATEKFASEFYAKGGNIKAVMETDQSLGEVEYSRFMENLSKTAGNFSTPLLEYGIKYKQLSVDPVAEQLVQSEILSIQDVCRILNIPPHMIAELSHATFSNIEHQTIQFVQYSLRPIIKRIEVELEEKLLGGDIRYDVKFVLDGLLRGDTAARSAFYHNAILDGYMSRNEVRALEGLEQVDGLDNFLYPANEVESTKK